MSTASPSTILKALPMSIMGLAVGLGANAIQPGQMGAVHVTAGPVSNMLYFGSQEEAEEYASFQFAPSYYDSQYVSGNTDMTVTLILPPGIQTEEPRYFTPNRWPGAAEPESGYTDEGNVILSLCSPKTLTATRSMSSAQPFHPAWFRKTASAVRPRALKISSEPLAVSSPMAAGASAGFSASSS